VLGLDCAGLLQVGSCVRVIDWLMKLVERRRQLKNCLRGSEQHPVCLNHMQACAKERALCLQPQSAQAAAAAGASMGGARVLQLLL
jgi:hypothetical protein